MQSPRAEAAPRERERRQALLLRLMQGQRDTNDSDAIMSAAADAIGRYLGANRAGFLEMVDEDTLNYGPSWTDGKLPPLRGLSSAHDMGTRYLAAVRAGHTLAISDMASDPLTSDSTFAELGVRSGIGAPIFRGGRWLAGLYVHQTEARVWTRREVELVRVVAEQTWDAVERARAVLALRESEAQLRFLDALGEAARDSVDASAMMKLTVRMLGEHLKVNWCAYANVEADNDQFTILDDWTDEGLSRIGTYRLHRFGPRVTADLRAGRAVIIDDADRQFAAGEELEASQKSGIKALICYPHVSAGRLLAMMAVFQTSPRRWTEHEIGLVAAVVER
jgi:GAF domain-containing protein